MLNEESKSYRKNIVNIFDKKIKNKKICVNLEKGIFNYSINLAKKKKIVRKWENEYFVQIYKDRIRSIYSNILNKDTNLLNKLKKKK